MTRPYRNREGDFVHGGRAPSGSPPPPPVSQAEPPAPPPRPPGPTRPVGIKLSERGPQRQPLRRYRYRRPGLILSRSCDACDGNGDTPADTLAGVAWTRCGDCAGHGTVVRHRSLSRAVHNMLAHPLLVLVPPLGEWLHARTEP